MGQSKTSVRERLKAHQSKLKRGKHENSYLQKAFNKYGAQAFKFEILQLCSPEETDELERMYIEMFKATDRRYGYNIESGGNNVNKVTEEIRERKRGPRNPMYGKRHSKEFVEFIRRHNRGSSDKLTAEDVAIIKQSLLAGAKQKDLALKFGVTLATINKIKMGKNWGWILPELNDKLREMTKQEREYRNRMARKLYLSGMSVAKIAEMLNVDRKTVDRAITDIKQARDEERKRRNEQIRALFAQGYTRRELQAMFGLSSTHIQRITAAP